ncbi:MAG: membrane protein insertase YidC, partial [Propionibacteriaceae bacterium]|nr:membrane protein insertase YidC [Propionibacteriaceae bacterium]
GMMFPVGVLVYWLTSNIWTMCQQYILIHNNPAPNTPAYIDWEDRMRRKGKDPREIERQRAEKRRKPGVQSRTVATATQTADEASAEATDGDEPQIRRQQMTRQTRKTTDGGRQVVQRSQPARNTRAARKKKK